MDTAKIGMVEIMTKKACLNCLGTGCVVVKQEYMGWDRTQSTYGHCEPCSGTGRRYYK